MSGFRLSSGGLIDRNRPVNFTFNGRAMRGHDGDTLASALLANGVGVLGRSFKYHRPRGIYAAGAEDPNAMLEVRDAYGQDPALRAGQVTLTEGLEAQSVTGWPTAKRDVISLATRFAAPFLTAGFYYKTMKWPNWSWYEETIRKATGFGSPDAGVDERRREYRHGSCDLLVIGAGPAGLAAVAALSGTGRRIVLVDSEVGPGGSLRFEDVLVNDEPGAVWASNVVNKFCDQGGTYLPNTFATGAYEGNFFTLVESLRDARGVAGERFWKMRARDVVLATGAIDRPLVYQNNELPGTMLGTAVRRFIGEYAVAPGQSLTVFTNNDSGYLTALKALRAGLDTAIIDSRAQPGEAHVEAARAAGAQIHLNSQIADVSGGDRIRSVRLSNGVRVACDSIALSGGATPMIHLAAHRGSKPRYDAEACTFICRELPKNWHAAGAVTGRRELSEALLQGDTAAAFIEKPTRDAPSAKVELGMGQITPLWQANHGSATKMWVDLQNDVKVSDVQLAARENFVSVEHLKRYTTLGMGTDQGRTSNTNGLAILASQTGSQIEEIGTTTFRPPYIAVRMGAIAHRRQKDTYQPRRLMPAHADHLGNGAQFEDFGWQRPDWYKSNGADRETAIAAEMKAVRGGVGVFDASPLGKIEIAGPDARMFVNRFYVSNLTTLKPGRIRYSVMCHDNGLIFDDGVVTCIDDYLFLAGPTSGNAEAVGAWFERWRQTEWPDMRVSVSQVTSDWAAIALSGPRARGLLARLAPDFDIGKDAFPHMHFREGTIAGVPARVARVSFTGELQYEISVPARYGKALIQLAMREGVEFGCRRIGMEAWLRLRLEKGYIHIGADTNGRTTPPDIGMGGVVAKKPTDFIGKRALTLDFNRSDTREELVGLRPMKGRIEIGGRILAPDETQIPCRTVGNVTSACDSPDAGNIGLALIEGGSRRMGEIVRVYADGQYCEAEICRPVFVDPANERLKA